jgi:hypothetical protein
MITGDLHFRVRFGCARIPGTESGKLKFIQVGYGTIGQFVQLLSGLISYREATMPVPQPEGKLFLSRFTAVTTDMEEFLDWAKIGKEG